MNITPFDFDNFRLGFTLESDVLPEHIREKQYITFALVPFDVSWNSTRLNKDLSVLNPRGSPTYISIHFKFVSRERFGISEITYFLVVFWMIWCKTIRKMETVSEYISQLIRDENRQTHEIISSHKRAI